MTFENISFSNETISEARTAAKPLRFKPIPAGTYNFNVYEVAIKEYAAGGDYEGKKYLAVDLVGTSGDALKKHLFPMVPLFTNWNVKEKTKDKYPNGFPTPFISFLEALGEDVAKKGYKFTPARLNAFLGKSLSVVVTIESDDYKFKKELEEYNEDALRLKELREMEDLTDVEIEEKTNLEEIYSRNGVRTYKKANKALEVDTSEATGFGSDVVFD